MKPDGFICEGCGRTSFSPTFAPLCFKCRTISHEIEQRELADARARGTSIGILLVSISAASFAFLLAALIWAFSQ